MKSLNRLLLLVSCLIIFVVLTYLARGRDLVDGSDIEIGVKNKI